MFRGWYSSSAACKVTMPQGLGQYNVVFVMSNGSLRRRHRKVRPYSTIYTAVYLNIDAAYLFLLRHSYVNKHHYKNLLSNPEFIS